MNIIRTSEINIKVGLDDANVPQTITWQAEEATNGAQEQECKAMLLSLFDANAHETLKIDLWTKDLQVIEMDRFMYQTLRSLCDTYFRATKNTKLANEMRQFVQHFGEEVELVPKKK